MDDRRLAAYARRQHGLLATHQLKACGLSASGIAARVATARLFPVRRTVYSLSPHADEWTPLWAAVLATDADRAVISHWTAGRLHRMAVGGRTTVHVTVDGGGRRDLPGIVVHRARALRSDDVVEVRGLRATSPARTVLDLGAVATDQELLATIREGEFQGVLRAGAIREDVATRRGHRGLARVRRVDPATAEDALGQTPLEDVLGPLLDGLGIPGLTRQLWLTGRSGARFRADFAYPAARLMVEGDGRTAHERATAFESDRARDADLGATGWQTLRFTRTQVLRTPRTVQETVHETERLRRTDLGGTGFRAA